MANQVGPNLKKFIEGAMTKHGISLIAAANLPGARMAEQKDIDAGITKDNTRTANEWLKGYDGKGFQSIADREAAFADPAYRTSAAYREAVAAMVKDTPEEIMGLQRPFRNVPDAEGLIKQARIDLFTAKKAELFHKAASSDPVVAAQARLDLVSFEQSPENVALVTELDKSYADAHPMETALKLAKSRGERVGSPMVADAQQAAAIEAHPMSPFIATNGFDNQGQPTGEGQ